MIKPVVISAFLTALIVSALFLTVFRPEPLPEFSTAEGGDLWVQGLQEQIDLLERRLEEILAEGRDPLMTGENAGGIPEAATPRESVASGVDGTAERSLSAEIAGLRSALKDLGYRIQKKNGGDGLDR